MAVAMNPLNWESTPPRYRLGGRCGWPFIFVQFVMLSCAFLHRCSAQAQAVATATQSPTPIAGNVGAVDQLSSDDRVAAIKRLMTFAHFTRYDFYLLNIPIADAKDLESTTNVTENVPSYPYEIGKDKGFIFETRLIRRGKSIFSSRATRLTRFVRINEIDTPVPIAVGRGMADAFLCGLIAKLYLWDYEKAADLKLPILDIGSPARKPGSSSADSLLDFRGPSEKEGNLLADFANPATYGYPKKLTKKRKDPRIDEGEFNEALGKKLREINVQPIGMLLGWRCASEMLEDADADRLKDAVYALVRSRFTARQTAKISAYCISYLEGWSQGLVNLGQSRTPLPDDAQTVLEEIASLKTERPRLAELLFKDMLTSYSLAVANGSNPVETRLLRDAVEGFYEGTTTAADELFQAAYALGYDAGYQKGFKDGYAAGYAAARRAASGTPQRAVAGTFLDAIVKSKGPVQEVLRAAEDVGKIFGVDISGTARTVEKVVNFAGKLAKGVKRIFRL